MWSNNSRKYSKFLLSVMKWLCFYRSISTDMWNTNTGRCNTQELKSQLRYFRQLPGIACLDDTFREKCMLFAESNGSREALSCYTGGSCNKRNLGSLLHWILNKFLVIVCSTTFYYDQCFSNHIWLYNFLWVYNPQFRSCAVCYKEIACGWGSIHKEVRKPFRVAHTVTKCSSKAGSFLWKYLDI